MRISLIGILATLSLVGCQPEGGGGDGSNGNGLSLNGYLFFDWGSTFAQYSIREAMHIDLYENEASDVFPPKGYIVANHWVPINFPGDYRTSEIVVLDQAGSLVLSLPLTQSVYSPIKFSPDGSMIAFKWWPKDYYDSSLEDGVAIFSLDGDKVQLFEDPDEHYSAFDWVDSDSLVLAINNTIVMAPSLEADSVETILTLPAGFEVTSLDVNEAGTRVTFSAGEKGANDNRIYWADLQERDVHQLTESPLNEMSPVWSPDSKYIAFQFGYPEGLPTPPEYRSCPEVYISPVSSDTTYTLSAGHTSNELKVLKYKKDTGSVVTVCAFGNMMWKLPSYK